MDFEKWWLYYTTQSQPYKDLYKDVAEDAWDYQQETIDRLEAENKTLICTLNKKSQTEKGNDNGTI